LTNPGLSFTLKCMTEINNTIVKDLIQSELESFEKTHPASLELFRKAKSNFLNGVPMNWMTRWAGGFPVFVKEAKGAHFTDVDGTEYIDFCLGDTGAMAGHAPEATVKAIARQAERGNTFMLPTEDALWVGEDLALRFGLLYWQTALTATDANRFAVRWARHITGRQKILVFNWCYHGSVDETIATLQDGRVVPREGNIGPAVDPAVTTKVVEWNDTAALEEALRPGDVACVLTEPALTNIGIVHAEPGFHSALREITRKTGTLLIIDETHTICCGPGGYTAALGLEPDMLTIGKPIAGGVPAAVYGFSNDVARLVRENTDIENSDIGGTGGTLSGNALSIAAMRATLEHVLTDEAFDHMIPVAERFADHVERIISAFHLPWYVSRLGCRVEYGFAERPPRNGGEAAAAVDRDLEHYIHLATLNRGVLMTPFHNMSLMCPETSEVDVDEHAAVLEEVLEPIMPSA